MFSREPHLRFTPPAADVVDYDLTVLETMTVADVIWDPVINEKEMVDRSIRTVRHGWRVSTRIVLEVTEGSATDTTLAEIWKRLMVDELEVSMDGTLYRDAVMPPGGWSSARMSEKNVGRVFELFFICTKLVTEDVVHPETRVAPPAMASW